MENELIEISHCYFKKILVTPKLKKKDNEFPKNYQ